MRGQHCNVGSVWMTGLPTPLLISVLCTWMGFSDVGLSVWMMTFLRLLPATLKRGRLQWHSSFLNIDRCISVKDCRAVFGSASCWKNGSALEGPQIGAKFQRLYRTNFQGRQCDHRQPKTLATHVVRPDQVPT